ncbi:MAG: hypothetical protein QME63_03295 [Actinomycetota bacterium]|nr:hypothetical protein [Actinomycetota bacterium]
MTLFLILGSVLAVAALILIGFTLSVVVQLKRTLTNFDKLVVKTDEKLQPLLIDLHVAIKQINANLDQIDRVVTSVSEIGDKVNSTTQIVHELVSSPLVKIATISASTKEALKRLISRS